ncbi:MAG: hypothetical protein K8J08_04815, partial [Thermoanaerobaculia bacterium]|nr:hypothetical protein [Thermoanaerobaculia bacterium]
MSNRLHGVLAPLALTLALGCGAPPGWVVVDGFEPWGAAAEAGVEEGDRVIDWRLESGDEEPTPVASCLDLNRIEEEMSPLGIVVLGLRRGHSRLEVSVEHGDWGLLLRPHLSASARRQWTVARDLAGSD